MPSRRGRGSTGNAAPGREWRSRRGRRLAEPRKCESSCERAPAGQDLAPWLLDGHEALRSGPPRFAPFAAQKMFCLEQLFVLTETRCQNAAENPAARAPATTQWSAFACQRPDSSKWIRSPPRSVATAPGPSVGCSTSPRWVCRALCSALARPQPFRRDSACHGR